MQLIAAGNLEALELMRAVWDFTHVFDDLIDQDKPITLERASESLCNFMRHLSFNSFWREHSWQLFPMLVSALNRWVDGEDWPDKKEAAVIRCGDIEFYLQVAYAIGGWQHMRACRDTRSYDKED